MPDFQKQPFSFNFKGFKIATEELFTLKKPPFTIYFQV